MEELELVKFVIGWNKEKKSFGTTQYFKQEVINELIDDPTMQCLQEQFESFDEFIIHLIVGHLITLKNHDIDRKQKEILQNAIVSLINNVPVTNYNPKKISNDWKSIEYDCRSDSTNITLTMEKPEEIKSDES